MAACQSLSMFSVPKSMLVNTHSTYEVNVLCQLIPNHLFGKRVRNRMVIDFKHLDKVIWPVIDQGLVLNYRCEQKHFLIYISISNQLEFFYVKRRTSMIHVNV